MRIVRRKTPGAALAALAVIVAALVPGVPAGANHPEGSCLDVYFDDGRFEPGDTADLFVRLPADWGGCETDNGIRPHTVTESPVKISFEITGPHDPDGGNTPGTPDRTCSVQVGQQTCSISYQGTSTGEDYIRGWIDHDGLTPAQGGVTEADMNEQLTDTDADLTDLVRRTWVTNLAARIDCDDTNGSSREEELKPSNAGSSSNQLYICSVTGATGNRVVKPKTISAEVLNGVNDPDATDGASFGSPDYTCTTGNEQNTCSLLVSQVEGEAGTAEICFFNGTAAEGAALCGSEPWDEGVEADGSDAGNDLADTVRITWETRSAALGGLDAEAEVDWNLLGQQHVLRGTVYDQFGLAYAGATEVRFEFFQGSPSDPAGDGNTPGTPDATCTTQAASSCTFTYTQTSAPGTDLVCAWTNAAPSMSGTSSGGTCDGEGLTDTDDTAGSADAPEPVTDDVDVVQKTWDTSTAPTRLDCTPENSSGATGYPHTITCTARNSLGETIASVQVDAEAAGPHDPDGTSSPSSPDFSCTTGANGSCSFTHGPFTHDTHNGATSVTQYRAWIDADGSNATVEADADERMEESSFPGIRAEPDPTDVVERSWLYRYGIDAEAETATGPVGGKQSVTVTVYSHSGNPLAANTTVMFELFSGSPGDTDGNTPASPDRTCTTVSSATCSLALKAPSAGTIRLCAWIKDAPAMSGTNGNGTCAGEGLGDLDDAAGVFDMPEPLHDRIDVVTRTAQAAQQQASFAPSGR